MNLVSIILLVALGGLVLWLLIDTTIWVIKKIKEKKVKKDNSTEIK